MKGPSLQKQFDKVSAQAKGRPFDVDYIPRYGYKEGLGDCTYHTTAFSNWQLVIDEKINGCDLNCKNCRKCGVWSTKERYFIACADIWRLKWE